MNKMSKKTEYALMALKLLNDLDLQSKGLMSRPLGYDSGPLSLTVSAKDIADRTHSPYDVIARVLQVLSSRGILKAEYGIMGGYQLARSLNEITVHELIEILESSTDLAKCLSTDSECDHSKNCSIVTPMTNLNTKVQNFYKSITLEEVLHV
jgi:Rrf2 family protein